MKKKPLVPGWLFLMLSVFYYEVLVYLWSCGSLNWGRLAAISAFALGFGGVLGFLVSWITAPRVQKWVAVLISFVLAVVYLIEFFLFDAYKLFMTLSAVVNGAGGIATGYLETVLALLVQDWWRIALMVLPIIIYAIIARCKKAGWKTRTVLVILTAVLYLSGYGAVRYLTNDISQLSRDAAFDTAVKSFGVNVALGLNAAQEVGGSQQDAFVPVATLAPETEPEQTEAEAATAETSAPAVEATVASTEAPTEPAPTEPGYNAMDVDFAALAESEENEKIAAISKYLASLSPSVKNDYTGIFEGKNLIFITAEALHISVVDQQRTPTLYRLMTEGIYFTEYYQPAWGGGTTSGEFTNISGLFPATGVGVMNEFLEQDMFLTIGHQLQDLGYFSIAYHNNDYTYYNRDETHIAIGYDEFIGYGNGIEEGVSKAWPESDLEMMEFTVDQYIDQQPFSIYYMTVSGHCTYSTANNSMSRKNYDVVKDLDMYETTKSYLACQMELEYAMQYLVGRLEEAGIADDTVIVLSTDHYPYGLAPSDTWGNTRDYMNQLGASCGDNITRDAAPLIIWSGCLEDQDIVVDEPVYSLDILPTISNLFGIDYDSRLLVGRDVFSEEDALVFWIDYSWKTELGYYNSSTTKFTPNEGVEVPEGYVDYINSLIKNKVAYSRGVQNVNYFDYIKEYMGE